MENILTKEKADKKSDVAYVVMLLVEILVVSNSVYIILINNINHLNAKSVINIAFDALAMLILIIINVSCIYGRKNDSSNSFMLLLFSVYLCMYFDLGSWMVNGISAKRIQNYVFNIGCNCMMIVCALMFFYFTCRSLDIKLSTIRLINISVNVMALIGIVAELFNIKYGYFYYIDRYGIYARNYTGSISGYIPFVYILGFSGYLILRNRMSARAKLVYMMYILVPFIASGWYMITEYPPTFVTATFLGLVLIYANIYIKQGNEATRYELENAYKEAELAIQRNKQTLSQIRPHFIFNALGSIEELCIVDAKKAEEAVHYFAKYLRANMDALGEKELTNFNDELEHVHNYIWLEKMRFDDELEFSEDISVTDFLVPTLSIQPLVENAVKHGMMGMDEGVLHVKLSTRRIGDYIEVVISDDGCGFDINQKKDDGRSHVGMSYAKSTIENRLGGSVDIESEIGKGTTITLKIKVTD